MTARWRVAATRQVRESAETGVHVEGARAEVVSTFREATALLAVGLQRRHVAATTLNRHSSRSHTILRLVVESKNKAGSALRSSTLALVRTSRRHRRYSARFSLAVPGLRSRI